MRRFEVRQTMETRKLIEQNRATRRLQILAFWGGLGGIISAWGLFGYNWLDYAPGVAGAIVAIGLLLAFSSSIPAVFAIPPTPPPSDTSDLLTFEQRQRLHAELDTRNQQMEAVEGNTIRLGKVKLDSGTWGDLADVLYSHGWRWRRDIVAEAGVFRSLSGRFPAITAEMVNIDFIEGRPRKQTISPKGRHWFVEQSPNLFLEHVRI
jgi:hypothetical protein